MYQDARVFFDAIAHSPADDAPRLIFADWLEEQGATSRAEFIRLQIRRETLKRTSTQWGHARFKEKQLISRHSSEWFGSTQGKIMSRKFNRGFIQSARIHACAIASEPERIFAFGPIEHVSLSRAGEFQHWGAKAILAPELAYVSSLNATNFRLQPGTIVHFAQSPGVRHLHFLDLSNNHVSDEGVRAIANSPHFERLQVIRLENTGASEGALRELAYSKSLPQLASVKSATEWISRFSPTPTQ